MDTSLRVVSPPDEAHAVESLDRLQADVEALARQVDELELKLALFVHKTVRAFFARPH